MKDTPAKFSKTCQTWLQVFAISVTSVLSERLFFIVCNLINAKGQIFRYKISGSIKEILKQRKFLRQNRYENETNCIEMN
jgi:hypothetical protein